jgi:plasmid maintenance system antidote protein VapI
MDSEIAKWVGEGWVAKLVEGLLATATFWVRIQTSFKIRNRRHKRRIGQQTVVRPKNIQKSLDISNFT